MSHTRHTIIAFFLVTSVASPARALDYIYSPNVEEGEMAVEYSGSRTFDHAADKNNVGGHELHFEYTPTNRWMFEVSGGFAKDPGRSLKLEDVALENRFQFFEQGANWMDSGLLVAYNYAIQSHTPDTAEVKLLLQKDTGWLTHTANIGFTQTLGRYSGGTGGPDYVLLWNSRYRYNAYFQPGIELQSDFGQDRTLGHFDRQQHYIGPAVYGRLLGHVYYETAYLFGASNASAQSSARLLVEYEMHF